MSALQLYQITMPPEATLRWRMYNRYGWHQAMLRFFGDSHPETLLWRVEHSSRRGCSCTVLTDGRIVHTDSMRLEVKVKPYPMAFLNRHRYRFAVDCTPSYQPNGSKSKAPVPPEKLVEWFTTRAPGWGFSVESLLLNSFDMHRLYRKGGSFVLPDVEYRGVLAVTDREKFIGSALHGIGSKLSFGFGFLQLALIH